MIADKVGIHITQIKRYEAGTAQPTLEAFYKIVLALNISADSMLFEKDERGPDEEFGGRAEKEPGVLRRCDELDLHLPALIR